MVSLLQPPIVVSPAQWLVMLKSSTTLFSFSLYSWLLDSRHSWPLSHQTSRKLSTTPISSSALLVTGWAISLLLFIMPLMILDMELCSANTPVTPSISSTGYINSSLSSKSEAKTWWSTKPIYFYKSCYSIKYIYELLSLLYKPQ